MTAIYTLMPFWGIILLIFYCSTPMAIDPQCDYEQDISMGQEYYIYNNEYPKIYQKPTSCSWTGTSPLGTIVVLSCNDIDIPYSTDCTVDRLIFSTSGDHNFQNNLETYCGTTSLTAYTTTNSLAVGLYSPTGQPGGKFLCALAAMRVDSNCNCGFHNEEKIVGGQETGINEYPSMAGLLDIGKSEVYCGASIINSRYCLTAAHCLLHQSTSNLGLLVGDHDIDSGTDTDAAALYPIEQLISHPLYDQSTQQNDIAVVKTKRTIQFNMGVQPICLPFRYGQYSFEQETVTATGWGQKDFSGNLSNTLQKVDLQVINNRQCDEALRDTITATQICTYAPGKDSCLSDSGGPVMWLDRWSGKLQLVGIISFGVGCATRKPAVNTRVTSYLSWIASVTSDAAYCIQ